jgi:hypothetical protein
MPSVGCGAQSTWAYKNNITPLARPTKTYFGFAIATTGRSVRIAVPYWFVTLLLAAFALIFWRKHTDGWRFTIRSLLVTTMLIATLLGLNALLSR